MSNESMMTASRRDVLKAGGALSIALWLPQGARANDSSATGAGFAPNAFVRIDTDNTVTVVAKHLEMGQGVYTGLATIVADELDADWKQIRVEGAPADAKLYNNLAWGPFQGTGGSTSIANSYEQLRTGRRNGARDARERGRAALEGPCERDHDCSRASCSTNRASRARFGELVADAAKLPVPTDAKPKDPAKFRLIGKDAPRVDSRAKSTGAAMFTQDVKLPGMLTAVVAHAPRFGAKVKSFDAAKAKAIKGVKSVVAFETPVRSGVAVLATDFWSAKQGPRRAAASSGTNRTRSDAARADLFAEYRELAKKPGDVRDARKATWSKALASAARTLEATYEFPYLAHATMEPMNCVVRIGAQDCEVWNGEQFQTVDQMAVAKLLGLPPPSVKIQQLYAGGSFGRRANPQSDYVVEAAAIAKAGGRRRSGQAGVDARGRHARRLLPADVRAHAQGRPRRAGQASSPGSIASSASRSSPARRSPATGPIDPDVGRRRVQPAVRTSRTCRWNCTRPKVRCRCSGGARSARRTRRSRPNVSSTRSLARRSKDPYALRRVAARAASAAPGRARSGRGEVRLEEQRAATGRSVRPRAARVVQHGRRAGREVEAHCERSEARARRLRGRLRLAVNPNIVAMQMESGIGYGLSAALQRRDHASRTAASSRATSTTIRCCASTRCRRSKCTSCRRRTSRPASASRARR